MSIKVSIKLPDFEKWEEAVEELTHKVGFKLEETAKEAAPVDSGTYRNAISYDGGNSVTAYASYSADIEYGTGAHEITAQTADALHFKQNGKDVFYKKVKHPGTKPNPIMRNSAKLVQGEIKKIWQEVQRENGL